MRGRPSVPTVRRIRRRPPPDAPDGLAAHPCLRLGAPGGRAATWTLRPGDEVARVEVTGRFVANGMRFLAELAATGHGVALLDDTIAADLVARGALVRVLPEWRAAAVPVHAVTASRRLPLRTRLFLERLDAHLDLGAAAPAGAPDRRTARRSKEKAR